MADPRKLKDEAAAAVEKGKYKKALELYERLERLEPRDGLWSQRAGEMCRRLGQPEDAVVYLVRAVDRYSEAGFLLKAIAVCKIILEIDPTQTATQERLAGLHAARASAGGSLPSSRPPAVRASTLDELPLEKMVASRPPEELASLGSQVHEIVVDDEDSGPLAVSSASDAARAVLPRVPLFSSLPEDRLLLLIERARLRRLAAGEVLFRRGDAGDALYVISEGRVSVLVEGPYGGVPITVARLGEAAFFGEIALVTRQPRMATIRADVDTDLLCIDRAAVQDLVETSPQALKVLLRFVRERLVSTLLETSPLFATFAAEERRALIKKFRLLEAEPEAPLVSQGQPAPGLFILLSGGAEVLLDGRRISTLGTGGVFGEISLLTRGPARATVRTTARSLCLEMPAAEFHTVLSTHPGVLEYVGELAAKRSQLLNEAAQSRVDFL